MLTVVWYRFRATFRRRWPGYLVIALLIGLVGGVAMASIAGARRTESSYPTFLAGTNPSDLLVQPCTSVSCTSGFIAQIARLPHVKRVSCANSYGAETLTPSGGLNQVLLAQVELIASEDGEYARQDRVTITEGRAADPSRADEIVATPTAAAFLGLHVGSHFNIGVWRSTQSTLTPYRVIHATLVGVGVFNTQVIQDDIDHGNTGFLLGTPAMFRQLTACCQEGTYDGIAITGGSRYDTTVEHEYAHLVATSSYTDVRRNAATAGLQHRDHRSGGPASHRPEAVALGVFGGIAALAAILIGIQAVSRQLRAHMDEGRRAAGSRAQDRRSPPATGCSECLGAVVIGSLLAAGWRSVSLHWRPSGRCAPSIPRRASTSTGRSSVSAFLVLVLGIGGWAVIVGYRQAPHRVGARGRGPETPRASSSSPSPADCPCRGSPDFASPWRAGAGGARCRSDRSSWGRSWPSRWSPPPSPSGPASIRWSRIPISTGGTSTYAYYSTDGYGPVPTSTDVATAGP